MAVCAPDILPVAGKASCGMIVVVRHIDEGGVKFTYDGGDIIIIQDFQ